MKLCSIASSSSGNCIYIGSDTTNILIDAGISKKKIDAGLETLGLTGDDISAIFVTHEHSDHIQGVGVFSRKYHAPIYGTAGTIKGIKASKSLGNMEEDLFHVISADDEVVIGDLTIHPFTISHDANEPCGYRVYRGEKSLAVATDMGTYDSYIVEELKEVNGLLLEANHDIHMLEVGPYPYPLKRRVMGDHGHLSNELSGQLLCDILHDKLEFVLLGHLSKENNYAKLAYETVKLEVTLGDNPYNGEELTLSVADREEVSEIHRI